MVGEWLTAKKRGRDDEQIARDKRIALQQRKQQRCPKAAVAVASKPKSPKQRSNQKKKSSLDSIDDDDDDDFIVEDDDDEEEEVDDSFIVDSENEEGEASFVEDSDNEDDDEDSENDKESLKKRAAMTKKKKSVDRSILEGHDDSSSDSIEEVHDESSFFPKIAKKLPASKAIPLPSQRGMTKATNHKKKSSNGSSSVKVNPLAKFAHSEHRNATQSFHPKSTTNRNVVSLESSDSDGHLESLPRSTTSVKVGSKKANADVDDEDISTDDGMPSESKPHPSAQYFANSLRELEDTPILPQAIRKRKLKRYQPPTDKSVSTKQKQRNTEKKKLSYETKTIDQEDYCSDIDEAIAIACAMEESTKSLKSSSRDDKPTKPDKKNTTASTIYLTDPSDDDDDDDEKANARNEETVADYVNVDDDEEEDQDALAAKSILETAKELSRRILRTMAQWTHTAIDGIIVDGALALSTIAATEANHQGRSSNDDAPSDDRKMASRNNNNDDDVMGGHEWISNDVMVQILPNVKLSEYQLIGVNWIALLHGMKCEVEGTNQHTNVNGILADEMGLGKTCQTIAFLSWLKYKNEESKSKTQYPHLVIAPASVVSNWEIEFQKFAPHLNVVKYHGSMNERQDIQTHLRKYLPGNLRKSDQLDIIIAPVTYFQQEKSDDRYFLKKFQYDYMIVDEAHLLKNSRGMRYKSLDRFKTMHRLLLTGTPVQNSPKELMSLLCFLMPIFSRKSSDEFDESQGHDGGESMLQYFVSIQADNNDGEAYRKLKQLFSPFVLRRRKDDVLSQILPPKEQRVEFVELDPESRLRYNAIIADHVEKKKKGSVSYEHLFTQLRKAAHHPLMLRSRYTTKAEKEHLHQWFFQYGAFRGEACTKAKVADEVENFTDFEIHLTASELIEENPLRRNELGRYVLNEEDLFCSAKFVRLRQLLPELISQRHRILIFSVWTTCLDLLGCLLEQMNLQFLRMDGQTAVSDRQNLIDRWNRNIDIPVFLLSTKACGLGLNLTSADTCIQHDLDFNPFNDLQAEDRCHRIGQTKKVTIIKMVSKDTVDEDIFMMQQRKAKMNAAIMGSEAYKKPSANDTKQVLETAVNRFLQSPTATAKKEKVTSTKENLQNADYIEIL